MVEIIVNIEQPDWEQAVVGVEARVIQAAQAGLDGAGKDFGKTAELCIVLGDAQLVRRLNRDYRGKDSSTNVLSFPTGEGHGEEVAGAPRLLGDVVVCFQTVSFEAKAQGKRLGDHLSHLVVHGVLHLLGFDHQNEEEAAVMEALEVSVLGSLNIDNPYKEDKKELSAHG